MTADEKRSIALHEAGHATISWFCQYANPLIKVTIVPRGQALGAAWYLPEERQITTKEQMLDEMCSLMGGRAAEELFTGHISSGAMNDLERATKSAYGMVAYLGMSKTLPNICFYNRNEYSFQRPYSETTARKIKKYLKWDLIILDDFLLHTITDEREIKILFELLEKRNEQHRSTIVCSQRDPDSWKAMILNDEVSANSIMKRATKHYTIKINIR